jgi:TRAP-type C4-dicarboxylate transport system permease small subunit
MLRKLFDGLFRLSGVVAAFFLLAIGLLIVAQIVGRFVGVAVDSIEVSGFCMAASTFFGLAATLKSGTHIRVNLIHRLLNRPATRALELWCTGAGALAMAYFGYQSVLMVVDTYLFGEMTKGLIIMALWIPQAGMAAGVIVLALALADEFVAVLRGAAPSYAEEDALAQVDENL